MNCAPRGTRGGARARFRGHGLGRATPYGVYDLARTRAGSPSASTTTRPRLPSKASPAGGRAWAKRHPNATSLLITADGGGSNASRSRLWKLELQGSRTRPGWSCDLPPPTRHQQMEQDRASALLVYHPELARETAGQLQSHRPAHRGHDHQQRSHPRLRHRRQPISQGSPKSQKPSSTPSRSDMTPSIPTGTTPSLQSEPIDYILSNIVAVIEH